MEVGWLMEPQLWYLVPPLLILNPSYLIVDSLEVCLFLPHPIFVLVQLSQRRGMSEMGWTK